MEEDGLFGTSGMDQLTRFCKVSVKRRAESESRARLETARAALESADRELKTAKLELASGSLPSSYTKPLSPGEVERITKSVDGLREEVARSPNDVSLRTRRAELAGAASPPPRLLNSTELEKLNSNIENLRNKRDTLANSVAKLESEHGARLLESAKTADENLRRSDEEEARLEREAFVKFELSLVKPGQLEKVKNAIEAFNAENNSAALPVGGEGSSAQ